eukprot:gene3607-biopygen7138
MDWNGWRAEVGAPFGALTPQPSNIDECMAQSDQQQSCDKEKWCGPTTARQLIPRQPLHIPLPTAYSLGRVGSGMAYAGWTEEAATLPTRTRQPQTVQE